METARDPGKAILDEIAEFEVERAKVEAKIARRMLDFQDLRRTEADRNTDPRRRDLEASFAADELGVTLHQPTRVVQCRLAAARRVRGLLPQTWLAFTAGKIDSYRISLISSAAEKIRRDNHALIELDYLLPGKAASQTAAQLKGWLKRFVARNVTDDSAVKAEQQKRGVWLNHQDDGMSYLNAYIPTADAIRIDAELTARAKALPADDRTLDQKRADELVKQLRSTGDGQSTSSRAIIGITVPVSTVAGWDDQPGESFDGSFAMPADAVRDLMREPGTLFYRILTDPLGKILDIAELGRFASPKLSTAIDIRDGTCKFITCSRPSMESDKDHKIPYPHGPTSGPNMRGLCRRHHQMKTHRITEPTAHQMGTAAPSRLEHDLATYTVQMQYAA